MAEVTPAPTAIPLQFDRVATGDGGPGGESPSVTCSVCQTPVRTE